MNARPRSALVMLAGALVWAVHFMASYGVVTLVCARGIAGAGIVPWAMAVLAAIALLALGAIVLAHARRDRFLDRIATGVAALAALAIVWETWLVTRGPPCA